MPRLLKRLIIGFAVFSLGLVVAGFIILRVLASRVLAQAEPVRQQLVFDWEQHANELEAELKSADEWMMPERHVPPELGCQLSWVGESLAVEQHLARCKDGPAPLDEKTIAALEGLKDQLLVKASEAPSSERDLSWMRRLRTEGNWRLQQGTPLEFFDPHEPIMDAPVLSLRPVRALALLRLLQGQRTGELEQAVLDVSAFATSLLSRPFVIDQLIGVDILERSRAALLAAGHPELASDGEGLKMLRGARLASAMVWHPWVPKAQRDRFLPQLSAPSRCAAANEALVILELGSLLKEQYPEFVAELDAWRKTNPCDDPFVMNALAARDAMPDRSWKKLLGPESFVTRAEKGEFFPALLLKATESTELGHKTVTELVLSLITARPFSGN